MSHGRGIYTAVEGMQTVFGALEDSFASVLDFTDLAAAFDFTELDGAVTNFDVMIESLSSMEMINPTTIAALNTTLSNAAIVKTAAQDIVTMLEGIATITEGIPDITLPIDVMGEAASVIENFQSIADTPISMTVTLNVNLAAEQIATELTKTNALSAYVKAH